MGVTNITSCPIDIREELRSVACSMSAGSGNKRDVCARRQCDCGRSCRHASNPSFDTAAVRIAGSAGRIATLCSRFVDAQPQRPGARFADAIEASRYLLTGVLEGSAAPGFAVAVVVDRRPVWSEGFGFADLEAKAPASATTLFRVGSISKSFTSVDLALLVERGALDLDAPVRTYLADAPHAWDRVTTRAIGGHLAGFRHYRSSAERLRAERFMAREVFGRLGMRHTRADFPESVFVGRTRFYQRTRAGVGTHAPHIDNSWIWAGGGFLSSAADVAAFGATVALGSALTPASRAALHRSQTTTRGEATGHGIGWFVETDALGRSMIGHDGESIGGSASLRVFPGHGLCIAMLDNLTGGPSSRLVTDAIADVFMRGGSPDARSTSCAPPSSVTLNGARGGGIELRFGRQAPRGILTPLQSVALPADTPAFIATRSERWPSMASGQ